MSAFIIALLAAIGGGTWVFTRLQNKTGYGNSKTALTGSAIAGLGIFIFVFSIALMIL